MPFKKGESGNPGGRGTERPWAEQLRAALLEVDPVTKKKNLRLAAEALVVKAIGGDIAALKEIGDRMDGKAIQQLTTPEGTGTIIYQIVTNVPREPDENV